MRRAESPSSGSDLSEPSDVTPNSSVEEDPMTMLSLSLPGWERTDEREENNEKEKEKEKEEEVCEKRFAVDSDMMEVMREMIRREVRNYMVEMECTGGFDGWDSPTVAMLQL